MQQIVKISLVLRCIHAGHSSWEWEVAHNASHNVKIVINELFPVNTVGHDLNIPLKILNFEEINRLK